MMQHSCKMGLDWNEYKSNICLQFFAQASIYGLFGSNTHRECHTSSKGSQGSNSIVLAIVSSTCKR